MTEKVTPGVTEKHLTDKAAIGHSQPWLTRRKSCLKNLISVYNKVTHLVDQGNTVVFGFQLSFQHFLSVSF